MKIEPETFFVIHSVQVAKFPFEEVLVCKQGSKDPSFPSEDSVTPAENSSVATLDTEAKTGELLYIKIIWSAIGFFVFSVGKQSVTIHMNFITKVS